MAQELLDKIAKGETPTAEEIGKYKNICKALNAGIEAWKQDIVKAIPAPVPAEITQLITDLDTYKSQLQDILNCSGQGYLRIGQKREALYASIVLERKELYFEPCLNADNIKKAATVAQGLLDKINSSKPGDNEVNASTNENKTYKSCRDGKIAEIEFNDKNLQISLETTASVAYRIWNIADKKYLLWWGKGELVGFYKVGVKPGYLNGVIVPKPEVIDYKVLAYTTGECATVDGDYFDPSKKGDYFSDAGLNKLKDKLSAQGATNTEITVKDCTDPSKAPKTVTNASITASAGQKGIQIEMCWDGSKWKLAHSFKAGTLKIASGFKGNVAEVEAKSNAVADRVKETGLKTNSFEDELVYKELDVIQALVEVKEATITLCNEAKVPDKYWNDADSPVKAPTLSGVGDGAITELKDIPELVGFALQIATEPETAKGMWNGIKSLTPTKVKKMLLGAANDKLAKYSAGGNIMKHEVGKDGVAIAMFVFGGVKNIKDGADLIDDLGDDVVEKLDEIAIESLDEISEGIDDLAGKSFNKALKEGEIDNFVAESYSSSVADAAAKKGRKLTWEEVKALFKRGNDFNKKGRAEYGDNFSEINLGNKKRIDTYIPGQKIISRKATDIDNISEQTWRNYCNELVTKYKVGTPVNSTKLLNEPPLSGKYFLEIPITNQGSSKLERFKEIAKEYGSENDGINIIFLTE